MSYSAELPKSAYEALASLIWGRRVQLVWIDGGEVVGPSAGTVLVSVTVSGGKSGYIYGFYISSSEANSFRINWVSRNTPKSKRVVFSGMGTAQYASIVPLNEGSPADGGTSITITNVNDGTANSVYQASLLYAEV